MWMVAQNYYSVLGLPAMGSSSLLCSTPLDSSFHLTHQCHFLLHRQFSSRPVAAHSKCGNMCPESGRLKFSVTILINWGGVAACRMHIPSHQCSQGKKQSLKLLHRCPCPSLPPILFLLAAQTNSQLDGHFREAFWKCLSCGCWTSTEVEVLWLLSMKNQLQIKFQDSPSHLQIIID